MMKEPTKNERSENFKMYRVTNGIWLGAFGGMEVANVRFAVDASSCGALVIK